MGRPPLARLLFFKELNEIESSSMASCNTSELLYIAMVLAGGIT